MSAPPAGPTFPRGALIGAGALIAVSIAGAASVRLTGMETFPPTAAQIVTRDLRFEDRSDGSIAILSGPDGRLLEVLAPGTNGFIRATMRGLARERRREDIGSQPPFRLALWADGRLTLEDVGTGRLVDIEAFGSSNREAFAHLLPQRSATP